ncbi:MAG: transporter [Betaproteobacteria bacterium RIFCSPLOWO2_12_FULL_65_14]|nr:MAG: transporter [Betaproteobacteria bacterium RIFCSPLOWO2_12_FULL_65_14]
MKWFSRLFSIAVLGLALPAAAEAPDALLRSLAAEAADNNADIQAARREVDAARNRVSPAAALDDPMLELGLLNVPAESLSLRKEEMTMKMVGLAQRLPYPGKRALRREVAEKELEAAENNLREAVNKVQREVKMAYFDLGQVDEMARLVQKNRGIVEQLLSIAESRYGVGQTSQADVLKAQTQLSKMLDELLKIGRERPMIEAELNRALGRGPGAPPVAPQPLRAREVALRLDELREAARQSRPQLLAQQSMIARSAKQLDLARKDYYPDFDVRFSYGQRDNYLEMRREDMISLTVAINLPIWRGSKLEPRVSEAEAMREQASRMYQAKLNEIDAMLRREVAGAEQSLKSVRLYESGILPQARLAVDASLSAYRVGRADFPMLLDSQMAVFNYELGYLTNVASQNKALAEIEFLTGKALF